MTTYNHLPDEFQAYIVKPLEIYSGENGIIRLTKITRKMEKLIQKHNDFVAFMAERMPPKPKVVQPKNNPFDVINLLVQMRYFCTCVAPFITTLVTPTYRHPWCKDCNRPYLED